MLFDGNNKTTPQKYGAPFTTVMQTCDVLINIFIIVTTDAFHYRTSAALGIITKK